MNLFSKKIYIGLLFGKDMIIGVMFNFFSDFCKYDLRRVVGMEV